MALRLEPENSNLSVADLPSWVSNTSSPSDVDLFFHCWTRPHCPACLSPTNPYPCSWCAISQTCVPNTVVGYPFGILAPIRTDTICPLGWRERWELRAKPFSCRCSSMTFVSVVVSVLATLVALLLIWMGVKLGQWGAKRWKARQACRWRMTNWTPRWFRRLKSGNKRDAATETEQRPETNVGADDERRPLLV